MAKGYSKVMLLASLIALSMLGVFWIFHNHIDETEKKAGTTVGYLSTNNLGASTAQSDHVEVASSDLSTFQHQIHQAELVVKDYATSKDPSNGQRHLPSTGRKTPTADFFGQTHLTKSDEVKYQSKSSGRLSNLQNRMHTSEVSRPVAEGMINNNVKLVKESGSHGRMDEVVTKPKRDVIIGMAYDIDAKNLAVFCGSVRDAEVCPDGQQTEVIIFAKEPVPDLYSSIAKKYSITLVPFNLQNDFGEEFHAYHPSSLRWALIYDYLKKNNKAEEYSRVWLADARDTWFQRNPFQMLSTGTKQFMAFKGVEGLGIRNCGWNGGWVKDCFGQDELADIGDNDIICSGVSVGDTGSVMEYLSMMSNIISGNAKNHQSSGINQVYTNKIANRAKFPSCERNGVDQGVHNVLVHEAVVPNVVIYDHRTGLVSNLQAKKSSVFLNEATMKSRSMVTNGVGVPVAVVHQYDRRSDLQQILFQKYVDWVKAGDMRAEWEYEPACKGYTYETNKDYFKKRCDLKMKGGATSAASCCKACEEAVSCSAFTFYSSVCFLKTCTGPSGGLRATAALEGAVSGWKKT